MRRGVRSIALALGMMSAAACADTLVGAPAGTSNAELFDSVWSDMDRYYSMFELRHIDWNAARTHYRPLAAAAPSSDSLRRIIVAMMWELKDGHVGLSTSSRNYFYTIAIPRTYFNAQTTARYVTNLRRSPSGYIEWGRLSNDVGYVYIPSFSGAGWGSDIDTVLADLNGVKSIVIDVRNNGGGNDLNARDVAGRLVPVSRTYSYARYRNGPAHADFTPPIDLKVERAGIRNFSGPIVLITNRQCASTTEEFAIMLRDLPNVTVVGDSTLGSSGAPIVRELPNGWTYRYSQWVHYLVNGATFEGIGLAPGVFMKSTIADSLSSIDPVLLEAKRRAGG